MRNTLKGFLVLAVLLAPGWPSAAEPEMSAAKAFEQLSTLIGEWEGKFADGRQHRVSYRLTAGRTTLVETWALAPGRESLTLYHLDGESLVADHYCPQGNQPRLQLAPGTDSRRLSFVFRDGTNLQVKGGAHQHSFWVELNGEDSFARGETYVENGTSPAELAKLGPGEAITYTRVVATKPGA